MSHSNISIFVPHIGCPNRCSFCNQHTITGSCDVPHADDVKRICEKALCEVSNPSNAEIAFFGGSFTAINREYMVELLEAAAEFVGENKFSGIRISTRPDAINAEILELLKKYGVTSIELGAQSLSDEVLQANDRGHSAQDVAEASEMIKAEGFELGLQMMVGLYKSTPELDMNTAERIINLKPKTARIYPTVILPHTRLATLFEEGEYVPYTLDVAVEICAKILVMLRENNINVIKLGLHASETVEGQMLGGLYHPAFRELCESRIYREKIAELVSGYKSITVSVPPKKLSQALGQKKSNIDYFKANGIDLEIIAKVGQTQDIAIVQRH